ncbi:hypothetical protein Tco_0720697 [Tanacetum coccineum]
MGEPLSPNHVFDFPIDEPEPHPAYDFFAPGPLPGYASNPNNNNNGWVEADVPLLGELEVVADEPMVGTIVDEMDEPIVEMEEQMIASVIDAEEDIAMLFGDDFSDDDSEGVEEELPVPPSVIEDLSTCLGNLEYGHGQLVKKVIQVSDAEVAAGISIGEIGPRVFAIGGHVSATERHTDSAAADYDLGDEPP